MNSGTPLDRLRPRDREVVRALIEYPGLSEADVADMLRMGVHNLRARLKHAYALLGLESRLQLYAVHHVEVLGACDCTPSAGKPGQATPPTESHGATSDRRKGA